MKPGTFLLTAGIVLLNLSKSSAQTAANEQHVDQDSNFVQQMSKPKNRMNFFVISRPKKLLDPPTRFNIIRAKIKSLLRPKRFSCIVAASAEQMSSKIQYRLRKNNALIGSLWFDSHGSYSKGYSLFTIGHDEFHYGNIHDSEMIGALVILSALCDSNTRIGIGSCYGGATYSKPGVSGSLQRMNGDVLMKGLGAIFSQATIYACESWVMTKPGLFKEKFAMAGFPLRKKFKDISFDPVWNRLGMWNSYRLSNDEIIAVNCVTLTKYGNIQIRHNSYQSQKKVQTKMAHNKEKLRPNLLRA